MAPRAYWKGSLKLSLVTCPIAQSLGRKKAAASSAKSKKRTSPRRSSKQKAA